MGLYINDNSGYVTESWNQQSIPEKYVMTSDVNEHVNFSCLAMETIAESNKAMNEMYKELAIEELHCFEENVELFQEGISSSSFISKIRALFKKIFEAIKKVFSTIAAKFTQIFRSNKDFISKYEKDIRAKWRILKDDWSYKGFKFTLDKPYGDDDILDFDTSNCGETFNKLLDALYTKSRENIGTDVVKVTSFYDINTLSKEGITEDDVKDASTINSKQAEAVRDASEKLIKADSLKEFKENLYEHFRNGETSKDDIEKQDMPSITVMTEALKNSQKELSNLKKFIGNIDKTANRIDKDLARKEKEANTSDKSAENFGQVLYAYINWESSIINTSKDIMNTAYSEYYQSVKDQISQYKGICAKVLGTNVKKVQKESYEYQTTNSAICDISFV